MCEGVVCKGAWCGVFTGVPDVGRAGPVPCYWLGADPLPLAAT